MLLKHNKHHVYFLNYYLVWCTKRKQPVLVGEVKERLVHIFLSKAVEKSIDILTLEIKPNYIYMLVANHVAISVHKIVKMFKGISSKLLRKEFPHLLKLPSLWTHAYFVSTTNVPDAVIENYVKEQSNK